MRVPPHFPTWVKDSSHLFKYLLRQTPWGCAHSCESSHLPWELAFPNHPVSPGSHVGASWPPLPWSQLTRPGETTWPKAGQWESSPGMWLRMLTSLCDRNWEPSKSSRVQDGHLLPHAQRRKENWPAEKEEVRGAQKGVRGRESGSRRGEEGAGNFVGSSQPIPGAQLLPCPWVLKEIPRSL